MVIACAASVSRYGVISWSCCRPSWIRLTDTYPFSGGIPAIAAAPSTKPAVMTGIRRARPPISDSLVAPVRCTIAPAHRNSSGLNSALLIR